MKHRKSQDLDQRGSAKDFTVDTLPTLRDRILRSIDTFAAVDVRVPSLGRLRDAESTLEAVIEDGAYTGDEAQLRRVAESIRVAQDFETITETLPGDVAGRIAGELTQALKGTLDATEAARKPFQFQTQYWFGGGLVRAGLDPEIPPDRSRAPDFVVTPGVVTYGAEVKRPGSMRGARDGIGSARDQLEAAHLKGIVVVDLSDCLEELGLKRFMNGVTGNGYEDLIPHFRTFANALSDIVWDDEARLHRAGFSSIFGIWYLARGWVWDLGDLSRPRLMDMQGMHTFASAKGNVWHHLGAGFSAAMLGALRASVFNVHRVEQESHDPIDAPFWADWF